MPELTIGSVNIGEALKLLSVLETSVDSEWIFQSFSESPEAKAKRKGKTDPLAHVWRCSGVDLIKEYGRIATYQLNGAGIFFQVNHGTKRGKAHVDRIRALFVDCDAVGKESASRLAQAKFFLPKPTATVISSPGRWHAYWCVSDCPVDEFKGRQETLARVLGTDPAVSNPDRVMRLPGTWNLKHEPFFVRCSV